MKSQLRIWLALGVALALIAPEVVGQLAAKPTFDPFPNGIATRYHFDLARNFFKTPDEETAARRLLISRIEQFQQVANAFPQTAPELLRALQTQDSLDLEVNRHDAYLELQYYSDTRNSDVIQADNELRAISNKASSAFDSALISRPDSWFARLEKVEPGLSRYRFAIENARRVAAHRLTPEDERAVTELGPMARGGGAQLFSSTVSGTDWGVVQTATGQLSVSRDYS